MSENNIFSRDLIFVSITFSWGAHITLNPFFAIKLSSWFGFRLHDAYRLLTLTDTPQTLFVKTNFYKSGEMADLIRRFRILFHQLWNKMH